MDKYGLQNYILSLSGEQKETLYSWGFSDEVITDNGFLFNVQGFLFNGAVLIIPNVETDTFSINLKNKDGSVFAERLNLHRDALLPTIDSLVEKDCSIEKYQRLIAAKYESNIR